MEKALIVNSLDVSKFRRYGRILSIGKSFFDALSQRGIPLPEFGVPEVSYEASSAELESIPGLRYFLEREFYAGMPCQIGYVAGYNQKLNGLEWHQGAEIHLPLDPMILLLGRLEDIRETEEGDIYYDSALIEAFRVEAGQAVLLNDETLHFAPVAVSEKGYRSACILPKGTNEALVPPLPDNPLITARNKWFISHSDLGEGVVAIRGTNIEIPW